jgi:RHS repeat-associated protein
MKNCKQILKAIALFACGVAALLSAQLAQAQEIRTYFITDAVGSPVIATDAYANVTWSEDYLPYGERRYRSAASGANERWFTNAPQNEDTGLIDLGNRQYDPVIGRFLSIDPVGASPNQPFSVNRYAYSNNNPYRYIDTHGNIPIDTVWDIGSVVYDLGKVTVGWTIGNQSMVVEGLGDAAADTAAMLIPYVPAGSTKIARMGARAADEVADIGKAAKGGGEVFERVVSSAELQATQKTGLLRGGREGKNFFTNSASLDAKRAQQRLGLDGPLRDARVKFKIKNNVDVTGPRTAAPGRTGTSGGSQEFSTSGKTEIDILGVDPLRK